jgi:hypothetical protein
MIVALISVHKMDGVIDNQDDELIALRNKKLKENLTHDEQERLKEAIAKRIKRIMEADIDKLFESPQKNPYRVKQEYWKVLSARNAVKQQWSPASAGFSASPFASLVLRLLKSVFNRPVRAESIL